MSYGTQRRTSVSTSSSLHTIGSPNGDSAPPLSVNVPGDGEGETDDHSYPDPSEATRLLGSSSSSDPLSKRKESDAGKQKLYSWLIKFGVISCILVVIVTGVAFTAIYFSNHRANILAGCVTNYNEEFDYFPEKAIDFGFGLELKYYPNYKSFRLGFNGQRYIAYQCGTPAPTGFTFSRYFSIPFSSLATDAQRPIHFAELLLKRPGIKFFGFIDLIVSPCANKMLDGGNAQPLAWDETDRNQQLLEVSALFLPNRTENPKHVTLETGSRDHPKENAINWIQFVALFFNEERLSNEIAIRINEGYECHSQKIQQFTSERPSIAWLRYELGTTGEIWEIVKDNNLIFLSIDAGGEPIDLIRNRFSVIEDFHAALTNVSYVIDDSFVVSDWATFLKVYQFNETSDFPFVLNGQVWRTDKIKNKLRGSDWLETAVAQPHAALEDLISVIHPTYNPSYSRNWFRNLKSNEPITIVDSKQCNRIDSEPRFLGTPCLP